MSRISQLNFLDILNIRNLQKQSVVHINDLRVCKSCGNIFSKKAGVTNILECPQCKGTSLESMTEDGGINTGVRKILSLGSVSKKIAENVNCPVTFVDIEK